MRLKFGFQQLLVVICTGLPLALLISSCTGVTDSPNSNSLNPGFPNKVNLAVNAPGTAKPLHRPAPPSDRSQEPELPQQEIEAKPVPAERRQAPATYIQLDSPEGLSIPEFEIPGPAGQRKRGQGHPVEEQLNLNFEEPLPNDFVNTASNFISTDFDDNGTETGSLFIPPDSSAAAGPNHVVNVVNTTVAFHTKDGTRVFSDSLKDFFFFGAGDPRNPVTFTFDPKVLFDQYAQRYVIVTMETTDTGNGDLADTSRLFLAVSDDDDPTGTWYITVWDSKVNVGGTDYWADYPGFAVDDKVVYISANLFGFVANGGAFGGNRLWIIDKGLTGGLYDNGTAVVSDYDPLPPGAFAVTHQPAHIFGVHPNANSGTALAGYSGLSGGGDEFIQLIVVDDPLGAAAGPVFSFGFINIGDIGNTSSTLVDAAQSGSATDIEVNDRRTLNAVWRDNELWIATTINPNSGVNTGQTTAYWIKLDTTDAFTGGLITVADQGEIGGEDIATGAYTFFPSITVNENGDAAIGFAASAGSIFPGAYFVTREAGDAAGTTSASQTIKAGVDYYVRTFGGPRNRWGDYSGAAVDPANGCLWLYGEWADTRGTIIDSEDGRWGTAYAKTCACAPTSKAITQDEWTMFSLACNLGQEGQYNTVADLFPNLDTNDYGDPDTASGTWVVFEYDAVNTTYVEKAHTEALEEGVGYWFQTSLSGISVVNEGMKLTGSDIALEDNSSGRFNLVGHPHDATIPWADVKIWDGVSELSLSQSDPDLGGGILACDQEPADSSCTMSRKMYQWNGAAYQVFDGQTLGQEGSLEPLDALWVESFKANAALRIPATPAVLAPLAPGSATPLQPSSAGDQSAASSETTINQGRSGNQKRSGQLSEDWFVRLIAASGDLEDPGNVLGQMSDSNIGKDVHDLKELEPFSSPYLSIVFPHQDWEDYDWGYTTDFHSPSRKPSGEWAFSVKASDADSEVTLRWEGAEEVLRKSTLINVHTRERIRLSGRDSYTFFMSGNEHSFKFIVR